MKKFLILFLLLIFSAQSFAQKKGYKISVKIKSSKDTMLLLVNFFADKQYVADTAFVNRKGVFVFEKKDKELLPGNYFISASGELYFRRIGDSQTSKISL